MKAIASPHASKKFRDNRQARHSGASPTLTASRSFVICLDDTLTLEAVRALKLPKNALFICRDTALDDTLSANLALQCRLKVL